MHPPADQPEFAGLPPAWTKDNTRDYLDAFPLPADFVWPGKDGAYRKVCPAYAITSYGKWLRETPYYPGLFDAIHDAIVRFGEDLPSERQLIAELERVRPPAATTPRPTKPESFPY